MAKLVYSAIQSLDGYVADEAGGFDWAMPDESVHAFINDLERSVRTNLLGRRMYEVMAVWETLGAGEDELPVIKDYGNIWRSADKIVYSRTLDAVSSSRTRIERKFDPQTVRRMKDEVVGDISIGGPALAAQAIAAGLVDEYQLFIVPVLVGGGTRSLPDGVRLNLELVDERRFASGMLYLKYRQRALAAQSVEE